MSSFFSQIGSGMLAQAEAQGLEMDDALAADPTNPANLLEVQDMAFKFQATLSAISSRIQLDKTIVTGIVSKIN